MYVGIIFVLLICRERSDDSVTGGDMQSLVYCRDSACYALIKTFTASDVYQTTNFLILRTAQNLSRLDKYNCGL